jgi:hypothetical protein
MQIAVSLVQKYCGHETAVLGSPVEMNHHVLENLS